MFGLGHQDLIVIVLILLNYSPVGLVRRAHRQEGRFFAGLGSAPDFLAASCRTDLGLCLCFLARARSHQFERVISNLSAHFRAARPLTTPVTTKVIRLRSIVPCGAELP